MNCWDLEFYGHSEDKKSLHCMFEFLLGRYLHPPLPCHPVHFLMWLNFRQRAQISPGVSSEFSRCSGPDLHSSLRIPYSFTLASGVCIQGTGLPQIGCRVQRYQCRQASRAHSRMVARLEVSGAWVGSSAQPLTSCLPSNIFWPLWSSSVKCEEYKNLLHRMVVRMKRRDEL